MIHNALAIDNCGVLTVEVTAANQSLLVITHSGRVNSPEIWPRILEPFFTTKSAGKGSGWGLDIVKKIVEKHLGKIQVTSVLGQRTFIVSIPIAILLT